MCRCWSLAVKDILTGPGPVSRGGGLEVDFVCLEAAGAAVDDDPVVQGIIMRLWWGEEERGIVVNTVVTRPFPFLHRRSLRSGRAGNWRRGVVGQRHGIAGGQ